MYILGDIGNSETKLFLVNSKNRIIKYKSFPSKEMNNRVLNNNFNSLTNDYSKIEKVLFCSVVPKSFSLIKKFVYKKMNKKCYEVKDLKLRSLMNIDVNYKQVGSDRLTNAIGLLNHTDNFIILDFGTATTFDVIIKKSYKGGVIAPGIKVALSDKVFKEILIPGAITPPL